MFAHLTNIEHYSENRYKLNKHLIIQMTTFCTLAEVESKF
jgi:hypothetical protein